MKSEEIINYLLGAGVLIGIIGALKGVVSWYYRTNEIIKNQESTISTLKQILEELKSQSK